MKKVLSKIAVFITAVSLILSFIISSFGGKMNNLKITLANPDDYSDTINVISVDDYINEELLDAFGDYTEDKIGKRITVNYDTLATPEDIYNEIKRAPNSANLLNVSEYMIMKMIEEDIIRTFSTPDEYYAVYESKYIHDVFVNLGFYPEEGKTYACGYMWGTMGFLYNADKLSAEDLKNWSTIAEPRFRNRVTIKDSIRDTYIMAVGAVYKDELMELKEQSLTPQEYNRQLTEIFNRTDKNTVDLVESYISNLRQNIYGFEVDSGKSDIATGKIDVNFAWSGDAACTIAEEENLEYVVPEEGSNVWFDGFVMTKNTSLAQENSCRLFLDYFSIPENVIANMDEIGYTSCVSGNSDNTEIFDSVFEAYNEEDGEYEVDLKYFFDPTCDDDTYVLHTSGKNNELFAKYADEETLNRCAIMANFDEESLELINAMWQRVKLVTFTPTTIIILCAVTVVLIGGLIMFKYRASLFKIDLTRKDRKVKKGYTIKSIKNV